MIEIERKFHLQELPWRLDQYPWRSIEQGYLAIDKSGVEVRLRRVVKPPQRDYFLTAKAGEGLTRHEAEIPLTAAQFQEFWPLSEDRRIYKTRYEVPLGQRTVELDIYEGDLKGLFIAELEFNDELAARRFKPPKWLGEEVTKLAGYKNRSLAIHGLPKS